MNYSQAVRRLKDDNFAHRRPWDNGLSVIIIYKDDDGTILRCDENGTVDRKWKPTAEDFFEQDWEVRGYED